MWMRMFSPLTKIGCPSILSGSPLGNLRLVLFSYRCFWRFWQWPSSYKYSGKFWGHPKKAPSMLRDASRSCFFVQQMWHAIKQTPIMFRKEIAFVLQLVTCVWAVPGLLFTHIVLQWCALYHIWALGFLNQHFAKRVTITSATHKIHPCIICHSVMFYNENQLVHTARNTKRNWNQLGGWWQL